MHKLQLKKIKKFLILSTFVSVLGLPVLPTFSFLQDHEAVTANSAGSTALDLEVSYDEQFEASEVSLADPVLEKLTLENIGKSPFNFSFEITNLSQDLPFCNILQVRVYKLNSLEERIEAYPEAGSVDLTGFSLNATGDPVIPEFNLKSSDDPANYLFEITLPESADPNFSTQTCGFDIDVKAFIPEYTYGSAFYDLESTSHQVTAGSWLLDFGFETAETLADDEDGNPEIGLCPVETADQSQNDNKSSLQVLKWTHMDDAVKYRVTGHTLVDDNWVKGTPYELLLTNPRVSINSGILTYTTWATHENTYAYYVEALNSDNEVIGATTPKSTGFTCTFTVDRVHAKDVIINEIMWAGSSQEGADEWIELYNTTDKPIRLDNYVLENAGVDDSNLALPEDTTIEPEDYLLIANFSSGNSALSDSNVDVDVVEPDLELADNGEVITLKDPFGNEIDKAALSGDAWAAGDLVTGDSPMYVSMERNDIPETGWHSCIDSGCNDTDYWDSESVNYGTPKAENRSENDPSEQILALNGYTRDEFAEAQEQLENQSSSEPALEEVLGEMCVVNESTPSADLLNSDETTLPDSLDSQDLEENIPLLDAVLSEEESELTTPESEENPVPEADSQNASTEYIESDTTIEDTGVESLKEVTND